MAGLITIFLGTISLILSVSPSPSYLCLATQDFCDGIWRQYQQYVLQNFIEYFVLGSVLMTLSVIILFLGRTKTAKTHPTPESKDIDRGSTTIPNNRRIDRTSFNNTEIRDPGNRTQGLPSEL
jgi:hypothetical protein